MTKTIVFVHGMFMTPLVWEHWSPWFEARGYRCLAPAWPGRDRTAAELRESVTSRGGTTAAALEALMAPHGLAPMILRAAEAARARAEALSG